MRFARERLSWAVGLAKRGRPSDFTQKVADLICERISNGESLRQICRDEEMPGKSTVMKWLAANAEFVDQYARAREVQADHFADEILEISDDGSNDWMKRAVDHGEVIEVPDHEHISRSKLRVDSRKWLMAKMAPKKYGDKVTTVMTGPNDGPIQTEDVSARDELLSRVGSTAARIGANAGNQKLN